MDKKEEKGRERRKKERLTGYHLVKYRFYDQNKESPYVLSSVVNISAVGLLFKSNIPIALNTLLDLKINFPSIEEPLHTLAKAVRIREIKVRPKYYEVGVVFIDINGQKTMLMDEAIKFVNMKLQGEKGMAVKKKEKNTGQGG